MNEMIERVARALFENTRPAETKLTWADLLPGQPDREAWMRQARGAIEAMREPSEEMIGVFVAARDDGPIKEWGRRAKARVWRAMIEEAVSPDTDAGRRDELSKTDDPNPDSACARAMLGPPTLGSDIADSVRELIKRVERLEQEVRRTSPHAS